MWSPRDRNFCFFKKKSGKTKKIVYRNYSQFAEAKKNLSDKKPRVAPRDIKNLIQIKKNNKCINKFTGRNVIELNFFKENLFKKKNFCFQKSGKSPIWYNFLLLKCQN